MSLAVSPIPFKGSGLIKNLDLRIKILPKLLYHGPQVLPQFIKGRAPHVPIAAIETVDP